MEYSSISTPPSGSIRFNTDSKKMEIYNGGAWWEMDATSPVEQTGGTRGILMGGESHPAAINTISRTKNCTNNIFPQFPGHHAWICLTAHWQRFQ